MLKTVKIGKAEYEAMKALSRKRGMFLQYILNDALRQYIAKAKQEVA